MKKTGFWDLGLIWVLGRSRCLKNDVTEDAHISGYRELHSENFDLLTFSAYTKTHLLMFLSNLGGLGGP